MSVIGGRTSTIGILQATNESMDSVYGVDGLQKFQLSLNLGIANWVVGVDKQVRMGNR